MNIIQFNSTKYLSNLKPLAPVDAVPPVLHNLLKKVLQSPVA